MPRLITMAYLALGVNAEFDACQQPTLDWVAIDQGIGRSYAYGVAAMGGHVYAGGYAMGNFTFESVHASNGASKGVKHESKTYAEGKYTTATSSQLGMDLLVYKVSEAGVPQSVYAVDSKPRDGLAENGGWSYVYDLENFDGAADTTHLAGVGVITGNLSFPAVAAAGGVVTLANPQKDNNGFVFKLDTAQQKTVWATMLGLKKGRTYCRAVATTAAGHVVVSGDSQPGKNYEGQVTKLDGATGAIVWQKNYPGFFYLYGAATYGEDVFVAGRVQGKNWDGFGLGAVNSSKAGSKTTPTIVRLDKDGKAKWSLLVGEGRGYGVATSPDGQYVYATGQIFDGGASWSGTGACSLAATAPMETKGFVMKINAASGTCVWAKPTAGSRRIAADATAVYAMMYEDDKMYVDATHSVTPRGPEADTMVVKYDAATGAGLWVGSVGGTGDDYGYDMALTPSGPVVAGRTQSDKISVGSSHIANLQHAKAEAVAGAADKANSGDRAMFMFKMSASGAQPPCLSSCSDAAGGTAGATVKDGHCFVDNTCLADGEFSAIKSCFQCKAATKPKSLDGPVYTNHCFFADTCYPKGAFAPRYQRYNQGSVCEWCDPAVKKDGWSIKTGFLHDREYATKTEQIKGRPGKKNSFGVTFEAGANGCQMLPSVALPTATSAGYTPALGQAKSWSDKVVQIETAPTLALAKTAFAAANTFSAADTATARVGAVLDGTGSFASAAPAARKAALDAMAQDTLPVLAIHAKLAAGDWKSAWGYYTGDAATCVKAGDVCADTPAASADAFGALADTVLHYGHSLSRVKTSQSLALGEATTGDAALLAALKTDVEAHLAVTYYQAVLAMAYEMDTAPTAAAKEVAQAKGFAYWQIISAKLLQAAPAAAAHVGAMFSPASATTSGRRQLAVTGTYHYCAVKDLLYGNLPAGSMLEYTVGTTAGSATTKMGTKAVHVTAADLGNLVAAASKTCTAPPPSPPLPPPPSPPPSPSPPPKAAAATKGAAQTKEESSALTGGQIAGIAVGGSIAGLILLGLIAYCIKQKNADKPVFTCLEAPQKTPTTAVKKDQPATSATNMSAA